MKVVMVVQGEGFENEACLLLQFYSQKLHCLLEASQKAKQLGVDKNRVMIAPGPSSPP